MASTSVHQAVHGYRDGHRLLSSSVSLSADAARAMLIMSDMSGPSMQSGFDEYLTGYPLAGADLFVFAKTWYAPEMQRPGCVWTHSLLVPRDQVSSISSERLMRSFRRPRIDGVDAAASSPMVVGEETATSGVSDAFAETRLAAALIGAVLGQPRPVILVADTAAQFEAVILRLWEELWPAERTRFSFCTGAIMPRAHAGTLLDLQAVPRAIPSSQFRKSAGTALLLDLRAPSEPEAWVELVLDGALKGDTDFRTWLEAAAGADAGRAIVPSLAPLYGAWRGSGSSARSALASIVSAKNLDHSVRIRLIGMVFDRANTESGAPGRRELLQNLSGQSCNDFSAVAPVLEEQTQRLFEDSRSEGLALVLSLLRVDLSNVGERVLRCAVLRLEPSDLELFSETQATYLPTIVRANHRLAASRTLWCRAGYRSGEVLSQLSSIGLDHKDCAEIVDAILSAGGDISVEALLRFGGSTAVLRGLSAISSGQIQLSWPWRAAIKNQPETVVIWLESLSSASVRDLELSSEFVGPKFAQARLTTVWKAGMANTRSTGKRVAAFGLALAFGEGDVKSPLFAACFQPTYDAAENSGLQYDEWEWLRDYAPSLSFWRDWDKCQRLANAIAQLLEKQNATLETVFGIFQRRATIKKFVEMLDDDKKTRPYLKALRKRAVSSPIGSREQIDALVE